MEICALVRRRSSVQAYTVYLFKQREGKGQYGDGDYRNGAMVKRKIINRYTPNLIIIKVLFSIKKDATFYF